MTQLKQKLPQIKKEISHFLSNEEGGINKKNAAQIGIGLLALGVGMAEAMKADPALAQCFHTSHASHASHASHSAHASHASHASHANY